MFERITDSGLRRRIKQHVIGKEHIFFASVQPGFEKTISREFQSIGLNVNSEFIEGGVEFTGTLDDCFSACISSRTASRIMMRLASFRSHDFYELERAIRSFPWELYLNPEIPVNFNITSRKSMIYHTGKLQEIFEKELPAVFSFSKDSSAENEAAARQTLFIRNFRDICTVSIDASGEFLYKRGMKQLTGAAPLRETLAALILLEADIARYDLLLDPMCGSGTFSIEAALIFSGTLPNAERFFPFMNWPSFKERNFLYLKKNLMEKQTPEYVQEKKIVTSDIDPEAVKISEANIPDILKGIITPETADFFSLAPELLNGKKTLIVLNPPYGKRIRETDIYSFYKNIGIKLKSDFKNCGYAVIAPGVEAEQALALDFDRKIKFMNGGIIAAVLFKDA